MASFRDAEDSASSPGLSSATRELARELWEKALRVQQFKEQRQANAAGSTVTVSRRQLLAAAAALCAASSAVGYKLGGRGEPRPIAVARPRVMFDPASGKAFQHDLASGAALPPNAVVGLWCERCRKWQPGPPVHILARDPDIQFMCRLHRKTKLRDRP